MMMKIASASTDGTIMLFVRRQLMVIGACVVLLFSSPLVHANPFGAGGCAGNGAVRTMVSRKEQ